MLFATASFAGMTAKELPAAVPDHFSGHGWKPGCKQPSCNAGIGSVGSSAEWRYDVVDLRRRTKVPDFHKSPSDAKWRGRPLNGRRPESCNNDYSQQNLLNLSRFEKL